MSSGVDQVRLAQHIVTDPSHPGRWLNPAIVYVFLALNDDGGPRALFCNNRFRRRVQPIVLSLLLPGPLIIYLLLVAEHVLEHLLAGPERLSLSLLGTTFDELLPQQSQLAASI